MNQLPPLEPRSPEQHLADFRKFFGDDLAKIDKKVDDYVRKLSREEIRSLPYYAVMFEQRLGNGAVKRSSVGEPVSPDDPAVGSGETGRSRR